MIKNAPLVMRQVNYSTSMMVKIVPGVSIEWASDLDSSKPGNLERDTHNEIKTSKPYDDQDLRLFEGYLYTNVYETVGVDIKGLDQHFRSYDVFVYLDADNSKSKSGTSIRSITDGMTTFYLNDADGNTFTGEYVEVTSTTANTAQVGNYVVFRGLTQSVVNIRIDNDTTISNSSDNKPAITAIQVVGQRHLIDRIETLNPEYGGNDQILTGGGADLVFGGSGNDDINTAGANIYGQVDGDIVVGDNGRATIMLGEVRQVETTDPEFAPRLDRPGSDDIIRTGNGEDLVLGGNGNDDIDTGVRGSFDYGDVQIVSINFNGGSLQSEIVGIAGSVAADNWNNLVNTSKNNDDHHRDYRHHRHHRHHNHHHDTQSSLSSLIFNNGSVATGLNIEWGVDLDSKKAKKASNDSHSQINPDSQNERLFAGYLYSSTSKTLGANITGLSQHFNTYDVYVYIDADDSKSRDGISSHRITDGTTTFYLNDPDGNKFEGTFVEVNSTDPFAPETGNYVVFRNLTSNTFFVEIDDDRTLKNGYAPAPAISAIQIVGGADKDQVVISGDYDNDAVVGDNGVARRLNGKVYELISTDPVNVADGVALQEDTIATGNGQDVVIGGNDDDSIKGEEGDDLILADNARILFFDSEVIGLNSPDHDHYHHDHDDKYFDPFNVPGIELLADNIGGNDTVEGGEDNDLIYGQFGNDTYQFVGGGLGSDRLIENSSNPLNDSQDVLDFSKFNGSVDIDLDSSKTQTVNDKVSEGDIHLELHLYNPLGFEGVIGSEFNDEIQGNNRNNILIGLGGDDKIKGDDGDDVILGGTGNDEIDGDSGHDIIDGGDGNDEIDGDCGDDVILGGAGNDEIDGDSGDDIIDGEDGNDEIKGDSGDDIILGGAGNDYIKGDSGRDKLEGGDGNDRIKGESKGKNADFLIEQDTSSEAIGLREEFAKFSQEFNRDDFFYEDPNHENPHPTNDRPVRAWIQSFLNRISGKN
jgi:hypothetical protein